MMGRTHLTIGVATTLTLLQPDTLSGCLAAVMGGALGGVLADIDMLDQHSGRKDDQNDQLIAVGMVAAGLLFDYLLQGGICASMLAHRTRTAVGAVILLYLWMRGG